MLSKLFAFFWSIVFFFSRCNQSDNWLFNFYRKVWCFIGLCHSIARYTEFKWWNHTYEIVSNTLTAHKINTVSIIIHCINFIITQRCPCADQLRWKYIVKNKRSFRSRLQYHFVWLSSQCEHPILMLHWDFILLTIFFTHSWQFFFLRVECVAARWLYYCANCERNEMYKKIVNPMSLMIFSNHLNTIFRITAI